MMYNYLILRSLKSETHWYQTACTNESARSWTRGCSELESIVPFSEEVSRIKFYICYTAMSSFFIVTACPHRHIEIFCSGL